MNEQDPPPPIGLPLSGRLLAIDLGEKRIGLALSDPTQFLAKAHQVFKRRSRREDFARIQSVIAAESAVGVVVGVPINRGSGVSSTENWVRNYAADLATRLTVPLTLVDESFTTADARASLRAQGRRGRRTRDEIDAVAAAFILQRYLDTRRDAEDVGDETTAS